METQPRKPHQAQPGPLPAATTHAEKAAKTAPISPAEREDLAREAARTEDA